MRIECFASLAELAAERSALAVPGLVGRDLGGVLLWPGNGDTGPREAIDILSTACARILAKTESRGWACAWIAFPSGTPAFAAARWLDSMSGAASADAPKAPLLVWHTLPSPEGPAWEPFWRVPLDPLFLNVVVLEASAGIALPPDRAVSPAPDTFGELLPWPWLTDTSAQTQWLAQAEPCISLLALGILSCEWGVAILTRPQDVDDLVPQG